MKLPNKLPGRHPCDLLALAYGFAPPLSLSIACLFLSGRCSSLRDRNHGYVIERTYPHDPAAFTQGLAFSEGRLFEATGLHGASTLRDVELETGVVRHQVPFPSHQFAEGVAAIDGRLIQLLWNSDTALVFDVRTLDPIQAIKYGRHGWGITHDGGRIVLSDGSATLRFLDPQTLREVGQLLVRDRGVSVAGLNELEFVRGCVFANVYPTPRIAVISPETGEVAFWIDLGQVLSARDRQRFPVGPPNGIAYDTSTGRLFVTGKFWPALIELRLPPGRASCDRSDDVNRPSPPED